MAATKAVQMKQTRGKNEWNKQLTIQLIGLYQCYPILYNPTHQNYMDRNARDIALKEIRDQLIEEMPGLTLDAVKEKINGLRTQFIENMKKVKASKTTGSGVDDVFTPKWYGYDLLLFLEGHVQMRQSKSNLQMPPKGESSGFETSRNRHHSDDESSGPDDYDTDAPSDHDLTCGNAPNSSEEEDGDTSIVSDTSSSTPKHFKKVKTGGKPKASTSGDTPDPTFAVPKKRARKSVKASDVGQDISTQGLIKMCTDMVAIQTEKISADTVPAPPNVLLSQDPDMKFCMHLFNTLSNINSESVKNEFKMKCKKAVIEALTSDLHLLDAECFIQSFE